jgi:tetratricopeptide (TPR) repeat protein
MPDIATLEQKAVELARQGNFNAEALAVNAELAQAAPANQGVWTRLARCHMELGQFDEAIVALGTALQLNPANSIARNLQADVMRRRAARPVTSDAASGFTLQDFYALGRLAPPDAMAAVGPKFETLLLSLNEQRMAKRIIETRGRTGLGAAKLFHRNSYHSGGAGHIYAYHHGGRWEPQFNIGLFSETPWGANAVRVGLGFNLSTSGRDAEPSEGQENIAAYFNRFQVALAGVWRGHLVEWMSKASGFIQYGDRGPSTDLLPRDGVEWLVNCRNSVGLGWVFVGRWLFMDKPDDARTIGEMRLLVAEIDEAFAALFPLWVAIITD